MKSRLKQDFLEKLAGNSGLNRRQFMERATATGITAAVASAAWSKFSFAAAKRGGHLKAGADGGATTDAFNPQVAIGTDHVTGSILSCYDTLTETDPDGAPAPSLAESWETSADGKTWRFKLRTGVEFHDGKSLTADDVVWSLNVHKQESSKYAEGKQIVGGLEDIKADGKDAVVIVQKEVNYDLPAHLTAFGLIVGPEGTSDWSKGIGTGPYMLENFEPGVSFKGKRHPNFYREDQGYFDSVELLNISDPGARSNALITKSVDAIGQPETKTAKRLGASPGIELIETPGNQHFTTAMRTDTDPFTNNHVRLAIKHGIKRQEILQKVFGGFGYVGNDVPIGKNQQFFNDQLAQRTYDPDKARHHLKQAGLSSLDVALAASDGAFSGSVDMAVLMQQSLKECGINMKVDRVPADGYWSNVWLKAPWCCVYWNGRLTVDWMLTSSYISASSWNDTYFKNARFDSLLEMARGEKDETKRRDMYHEAQKLLHDEGGTTVIAFASYLTAASDRVGHGKVGASRRMDDQRLTRRWWSNT